MGEARRRGTREERVAQAIAEGREKRPRKRASRPGGHMPPPYGAFSPVSIMTSLSYLAGTKQRRR